MSAKGLIKTKPTKLRTMRDVENAVALLSAQCRIMKGIATRTGVPELRDFSADFSGIAKIVIGQQLSAASASAIWGRVSGALQPVTATAILKSSDLALAALGLSSGKIKTLKALATATENGLDIEALATESDEIIIERLTAIHGIGPWTADIYLMFALRRADAFAPGDLALQLAVQRHFKLRDKPTPAKLSRIAVRWRPWRGVAARLLWADYGLEKQSKETSRPKARPKAKK